MCTANQCRTPMATGWARRMAQRRGLRIQVDSAGFLDGGVPVSPDAAKVMDAVGIDLGDYHSQQVTAALAESADAVATMTRQHLVQLIELAPGVWPRCFTLVDLVRRAEANPWPPDQDRVAWLRNLGAARPRVSIFSLGLDNDIADPMGGPLRGYECTRDTLRDLVGRLVDTLA